MANVFFCTTVVGRTFTVFLVTATFATVVREEQPLVVSVMEDQGGAEDVVR